MRRLIVFLCLAGTGGLNAQGLVVTLSKERQRIGVESPVVGAKVWFKATGEVVFTDKTGHFYPVKSTVTKSEIIISFDGYISLESTFNGKEQTYVLFDSSTVFIDGERKGNRINGKGLQIKEQLNENEFKKAACCTLSESFETTNTVEVNNADGISGIRQVEMLGLAGKYVLSTRDNLPLMRGLAVLTGMNQVPGPMVSGVQISKGTGSVSSGFEGLTGGINYGMKADPKDPKLFLNGYINNQLRGEGNLVFKAKLNPRTWNFSYLHYGGQWRTMDQGGDQMTDMPLSNRVVLGNQVNHWGKKSEFIAGVNQVFDHRKGGDTRNFVKGFSQPVLRFAFDMKEEKTDAWFKLGLFLNESGTKSIGQIVSVNRHQTHATLQNLNDRRYHGNQNTLYYSATYASPDDKNWSTRTGIQITADEVNERFTDSSTEKFTPSRLEANTGFFSEVIRKTEKTSWLLGMRADYNNLYGWAITPRFHGRVAISEKTSLHFQAGRGLRTAWVFSEFLPLLISNRTLIIKPDRNGGAYGLNREDAFNTGISLVKNFKALGYPASISTDFFYTHFFNQVVADRDIDYETLIIRSVKGNDSRIWQTDLNLMPHRRVEIKLSYRFVRTMQMLGGERRLQPLQSLHRALMVLSVKNRKQWFADAILQYNSPKRLPGIAPPSPWTDLPENSPAYVIANLMIRKNVGKQWEFYSGVENLLNVLQRNPIMGAENPYVKWFDAAYAWGPTNGRNLVAGFRLKIK